MRQSICTLVVLATLGTASAQTPQFNPTDIGVGTNSAAQAINASGTVVGYWVHDLGAAAFLYQSNQVYEIAALGTNCNVALALNDAGQVVGYSWFTNGYAAFHYDGTNVINLSDWSGTNSYATGINASNRISGFTETTNGVMGIYFDGQPYDIGSLGGNTTYAYGLNATGTIVGASATTNGEIHAFLQDGSGIQDLNALFPDSGVTLTIARAINSAGAIVGTAISNEINQPFLISDTNLTIIPLLAGGTNGYAFAINNANAVVGACETESGKRAFLWKDDTLYDLNDCATNANWVFREASGINDAGQIVGWGNVNGEVHAFLLTPNQAPSVTITSPTNNASFVSPFDLTITATATDDVEVIKVEFYVDGQLIGTKTEAPYTVTWPDVCAGNYVLTAIAYDNLGVSTTSAPVTNDVALPEAAYLKCWLKPESLSGSTCSTWTDSSGNGNNATYWGTAPQILTNQVNGYPAVKFNGTSDRLKLTTFLYNETEGEAFIIARAGTNGSSDWLWQLSGGYDAARYSRSLIYETFGGTFRTLGYNKCLSSFHLYNVGAYTNGWFARINGSVQLEASTAYANFKTLNPALGASYTQSGSWFYGTPWISEFLVFKKKLTTAQRISVAKYLSRKYALGTGPLPTPTLQATALASNKVSLTWDFVNTSDWVGIKVERRTEGEDFMEITRLENTSCYLTTVTPGQTYTYRIKFYNTGGETDYSNEATITTDNTTTGIPLSNITLWLRPDAGFPKNGPTTWRDQSGRGNNGTISGVSVITNALNGHPGVYFNGSNSSVALPYTVIPSSSQAEMIVVLRASARQPSSSKGFAFFGYRDYGSSTVSYYPYAGGSIRCDFATRTTQITGIPTADISQWHLFDVHSKTNDWAMRINGAFHYQTSSSSFYAPTATFPPTFGSSYGPAYFDGYVAEILIFDKILSLAEREAVGHYLNDRYLFVTNAPGMLTTLHCRAVSQQQIELSWNSTTNTTSYRVFRKVSDGDFTPIALIDPRTNKFTDTFQSSDPLTYRVAAQNYFTSNSLDLLTPLAVVTEPPSNQAQLVGQTIGITVVPNNSPTNFSPITTDSAFDTAGTGLVTVSNTTALNFSGRSPFTIECRVNPHSLPTSDWAGLVTKYNRMVAGSWTMGINASGQPYVFREAPSYYGTAKDTNALSTNEWTHLAGTYNGTNLSLYVNGSLVGTCLSTNYANTCANAVVLGAALSNSLPFFKADVILDEVRIWNKALSATTIDSWKDKVLNSSHPDYANIVVYQPLNGPTNTIGVTGGSFVSIASYNPFRVDLYADGSLYQTWTNETCETTFLSTVPRRWSFITLATDGYNNSRYSAPFNIDFIYPSATDLANMPDSDGDGLPDYIEDFITTNPNNQDTDGDGMPDWWEIWYGLNPRRDIGRDGASGDFDNDGISNLQEYLDGTNPTDGLNGGTSSTALQVHRPN